MKVVSAYLLVRTQVACGVVAAASADAGSQ
jgi:hypothetical protein